MHAGHDHNPVRFRLEEYPVRKSPDSRPPYPFVDYLEVQRMLRNGFHRRFHRRQKSYAKVRVNTLVPGQRFLQVCIRFGYPDDGERHCFLDRPALTCSQGMTFSGLR